MGKLVERLDPTVFTAPRRRRVDGRKVLEIGLLVVLAGLFVVFLFFAFGVPGI